ncbi:hypothetical protein K488DRAFT_72266 [Vararia minispora EC-137]|uniref:Uncharacterized protein n=1 Tax=Vararia minispora EC-137 TaxID=1314806 RepID=A0ACB8QF27_9AGAM|nr:hypothetical protein K488DRAFT_72266 [Vararia minispora EC-137]
MSNHRGQSIPLHERVIGICGLDPGRHADTTPTRHGRRSFLQAVQAQTSGALTATFVVPLSRVAMLHRSASSLPYGHSLCLQLSVSLCLVLRPTDALRYRHTGISAFYETVAHSTGLFPIFFAAGVRRCCSAARSRLEYGHDQKDAQALRKPSSASWSTKKNLEDTSLWLTTPHAWLSEHFPSFPHPSTAILTRPSKPQNRVQKTVACHVQPPTAKREIAPDGGEPNCGETCGKPGRLLEGQGKTSSIDVAITLRAHLTSEWSESRPAFARQYAAPNTPFFESEIRKMDTFTDCLNRFSFSLKTKVAAYGHIQRLASDPFPLARTEGDAVGHGGAPRKSVDECGLAFLRRLYALCVLLLPLTVDLETVLAAPIPLSGAVSSAGSTSGRLTSSSGGGYGQNNPSPLRRPLNGSPVRNPNSGFIVCVLGAPSGAAEIMAAYVGPVEHFSVHVLIPAFMASESSASQRRRSSQGRSLKSKQQASQYSGWSPVAESFSPQRSTIFFKANCSRLLLRGALAILSSSLQNTCLLTQPDSNWWRWYPEKTGGDFAIEFVLRGL